MAKPALIDTSTDAFRADQLPLDELRPAEWNANRVPDAVLAKVRRSIEDFGVVENLVVRPHPDGTGYEVISGNHRLLLYREMGMSTAPCHVVDVDDAHARILAQTLNRTRGEDDPEAKARLLEDVLRSVPVEHALEYLPETEHSIDKLLATYSPERDGDDPDAAPEPPEEPTSKPGEVYELGPHRLMCGDATNAEHVATLLDGAEPFLMLTDPPYGVELDMEWRDRRGKNALGPAEPSYLRERAEGRGNTSMSGDTRVDWSEAFALVPSLTVVYVWHGSKFSVDVGQGLRNIGFEIAQQIVWDKTRFAFSRSHYHWQHEPCWYARKPGAASMWRGPHDQSTIWCALSPKMIMGGGREEKVDHPTQKPVALYTRPIKNHLEKGGVFYEPFGGSGTAIIAAEMTGRVCLAMELDPIYVDVIRQRYTDFTAGA